MQHDNMKIQKRREYYLFSPWLRIFHWVMVDSIIVLFVTAFSRAFGKDASTRIPSTSRSTICC